MRLLSPADLRADGHFETAEWFDDVEAYWERHKTQRSKDLSANDWLNYQQKLSRQTTGSGFRVVYNASGKDANASVIDSSRFDVPFVVDYKAYWIEPESESEGHYLAAFMNAGESNRIIKDFQSRGLFGARDVSKTILEVPLPRFDPTDADHTALAELGADCATEAAAWLAGGGAAEPFRVGAARLALRKCLAKELKQIDRVLKRLV